ncbi:Chaperone modulatory protein CbpM [Ensifer adhaerens]|uniref:Chaperone modulatory protein CbpM n=1 Tax=Ensifer adhaerens TaxID=106592 RepID=A0ACC5T332_ENSAD|nr:chaperone modulator CbpM [Ensifer adhaerens]MBP1875273.1 chaperone modulatory protein CbpM [Ensifer adhaerens]NRP19055.1 Chaperone modulatory protein CbpM [Ensifer adhaerens]
MNDSEFCEHLEIEVTVLQVWVEQRWLVPRREDSGWIFEEDDLARARLIQDLTGPMGVNNDGVDVAMQLLDQIHGLRGRLRALMTAIRSQDPDVQRLILSRVDDE